MESLLILLVKRHTEQEEPEKETKIKHSKRQEYLYLSFKKGTQNLLKNASIYNSWTLYFLSCYMTNIIKPNLQIFSFQQGLMPTFYLKESNFIMTSPLYTAVIFTSSWFSSSRKILMTKIVHIIGQENQLYKSDKKYSGITINYIKTVLEKLFTTLLQYKHSEFKINLWILYQNTLKYKYKLNAK